jgi:hypothetical protein
VGIDFRYKESKKKNLRERNTKMFLVEKIDRVSRDVVEWEMTRDYSKAVEMQKSWDTDSTYSTIDNMS